MIDLKLSVCIPTYNRPKKIIKQVEFLINEVSNMAIPIGVEIIIRDNCSGFEFYNEFFKKKLKNKMIQSHRNYTNLGLII